MLQLASTQKKEVQQTTMIIQGEAAVTQDRYKPQEAATNQAAVPCSNIGTLS